MNILNFGKEMFGEFKNVFAGEETDHRVRKFLMLMVVLNVPLRFMLPEVFFSLLFLVTFVVLLILTEKALPSLTTGILVVEMILLGFVNPEIINHEIVNAKTAIFMLMTVVPFMMMLEKVITEFFIRVLLLSSGTVVVGLSMCLLNGGISAFADAVTVIAIGIIVAKGIRSKILKMDVSKEDFTKVEANLRSNLMSTGIGATIFGILLIPAEPYNPIAALAALLEFWEFFWLCLPVFLTTLVVGLGTLAYCQKFQKFGYGTKMPKYIWDNLKKTVKEEKWTSRYKYTVLIEGISFVGFIVMLFLDKWGEGTIYMAALISIVFVMCMKGADYVKHKHGNNDTDSDVTPEKHEYLSEHFGHIMAFVIFIMICLFGQVANLVQHKTFEYPVEEYAIKKFEGNPAAQATAFGVATAGMTAVSENMFTVTLFKNLLNSAVVKGLITVDDNDPIKLMRLYRLFMACIVCGATLMSIWLYIGSAPLLFMAMNSFVKSIGLTPKVLLKMCLPFAFMFTITVIPMLRYCMPYWIEMVHDTGRIQDKPFPMEKVMAEVKLLESMSHGSDDSHGHSTHGSEETDDSSDIQDLNH